MSERRLKLPAVNVTNAVDRFKREGGRLAEELVKLLETKTKCAPERGRREPGSHLVWEIGHKLDDDSGRVLSAEVFYAFTDSSVIWLRFRYHIHTC